MKEYRGFQAPVRCEDRACLASHKVSKLTLLLCQLRPRAIAALDGLLRQSLRSTVPLGGEQDGQRPPGGLFPQLAGGGFASPDPLPIVGRQQAAFLLHWWFSQA